MCQPNCRHTVKCKMNGTGYECDLNNDPKESMCDTCQAELDPGTEVDLDGYVDDKGIQYIGKATKLNSGKYVVLANVEGNLCRVEIRITPK